MDKLATSTRTPNGYDADSLKTKTISQDLELEANRLRGPPRVGVDYEALSQLAPVNLKKLINNVEKCQRILDLSVKEQNRECTQLVGKSGESFFC